MTVEFKEEPTKVPISGGQSVSVAPKQPWPSAYRGSKYSLVSDENFTDSAVLKWEQRDLSVFGEPPQGLRSAMTLAGKSGGYGSFRVTARGEIITKVPAEDYPNVEDAPVSEGWIPTYLGTLSGTLDLGDVNLDPTASGDGVAVWPGLPFHHGERWAVSHENTLVWKWRDYRFESAFDHSELVAAYDAYRPTPGRLYVTEYGHVWVNVPYDDIMPEKQNEIRDAIAAWRDNAESKGDSTSLRLVNRRLVATSSTDDPADGHLPIHLGHLRQFDGGVVPRPVVDDESYYLEVGQYEEVWE